MNKMFTEKTEIISYEELLGFYAEAGVDCAINDEPIDRFAQSDNLQQRLKPAFSTSPVKKTQENQKRQNQSASFDTTIDTARNLAQKANSIEELQKALQDYTGCTLKMTAKNTCLYDGKVGSPLMIIGEAPGREDDMQGIPFIGPSGEMLNRILASIGLKRQDVYLTNIIAWRPPGNRAPTPLELKQCLPFLLRQIELNRPRVLIAFGGTAMNILTEPDNGLDNKNTTTGRKSIVRARGTWHSHKTNNGDEIAVMPTFDPAYLLNNPILKKMAWADFLEIAKKLKLLS